MPEANRSPVRVDAPLTVMCASIWAGDQYMLAYGGRETTSPFHSTARSMSRPQSSRLAQVRQRPRVLAGQRDAGRLQGGERHHPGRYRGRERLAQVRPERHVLPGLQVAGGPVVDEDRAEHVLARTRPPAPACRAASRRRPRSRAPPRCRAGPTGRTPAPGHRVPCAGRTAGRCRCRRRRRCPPGRGSRRAGASSWASAARRRAGTAGRGWTRGARRRRSPRSPRPRTAAAAPPRRSGCTAPAGTSPAMISSVIRARAAAQRAGPSAMNGLSDGAANTSSRSAAAGR